MVLGATKYELNQLIIIAAERLNEIAQKQTESQQTKKIPVDTSDCNPCLVANNVILLLFQIILLNLKQPLQPWLNSSRFQCTMTLLFY